ncbi:endolysin [Flavobacterium phage 11b]|uniref:endolysin n=1 Tax=Flavobacterium phage 11b TaxID=294631 RepID=UPI000044414E|nr:endolysin [Flavobacterium phage 11b]CAH56675.1 glycoside hydrolase, family 19 [Flavobacterium phage 11b]
MKLIKKNNNMTLDKKYKTLLNGYHINTPLRLAHFMSQIEHESGGFKWLTELGGKSYFDKYEGRKDLGNTQPGDGAKFKGRGYIQVTGRYNYTRLSKDTGIDFLNNPDLLAQEVNAIVSACWFWSKNKINDLADKDDAKAVTKKINGGFNGLKDRLELLAKWKLKLM